MERLATRRILGRMTRCSSSLLACGLVVACTGCTGAIGELPGADAASRDPGDGAVMAADAAPGPRDAAAPAASDACVGAACLDAGVVEPPDSGGCETRALAQRIEVTARPEVPRGSMSAALPGGAGIALAWQGADAVELTRFDALGAPLAPAISVAGDGVWGVAAAEDRVAVLVSRGDVLALVVRGLDGTTIGDTMILGGVPHDVTNNEWFGAQLRAGRLDWTGEEWAAYATVQRLWPDGVAHYGDTLRTFSRDGAAANVFWDWGCSHSIEVRLTHNGSTLGPVCSSDCFPEKGVFFMHRTTVFLDSSGNCRGFVAQELGDVVPDGAGFIASFISGEGRSSKDVAVVSIGADRRVGDIVWVTDTPAAETGLRLGRYGAGLVAAWMSDGTGRVQPLDPRGQPIGAPEVVQGELLEGATDLVSVAGGGLLWANEGRIVRLPGCP